MDIIVKGILEYIQSMDGHKQSILAGGAVRDEVLGLEPKDYDICIPSQDRGRDMHQLAQSIAKDFDVKDMVLKTKEYEHASNNGQRLTVVYGFEYEGKKIDLIGHKEVDDEDFASEVVRKFDYGINMAYHNGSYLDDTNEWFQSDINEHAMTLINLESKSGLPNAMKRYFSFNEKFSKHFGYDVKFRARCLELIGEKKSKKRPWGKVQQYTENPVNEIWPRFGDTFQDRATSTTGDNQRSEAIRQTLQQWAATAQVGDAVTTTTNNTINPFDN